MVVAIYTTESVDFWEYRNLFAQKNIILGKMSVI